MNKVLEKQQMVNKTIRTYISTTTGASTNGVIKKAHLKSFNNDLFIKHQQTVATGNPQMFEPSNILLGSNGSGNIIGNSLSSSIGGKRNYSIYNLKSYPFYHGTKTSDDLLNQRKLKYQVACSHGHNGDAHDIKSDYFKNRKYHKKNEIKHGEDFDNKPIFPHIIKHSQNNMKTVSELKEEYQQLVEQSIKTAPKYTTGRKTQDKMKDFSLGVD